jgi:hypothetical protein
MNNADFRTLVFNVSVHDYIPVVSRETFDTFHAEKLTFKYLIGKGNSCPKTHVAVVMGRQIKIFGEDVTKPCHVFHIRVT